MSESKDLTVPAGTALALSPEASEIDIRLKAKMAEAKGFMRKCHKVRKGGLIGAAAGLGIALIDGFIFGGFGAVGGSFLIVAVPAGIACGSLVVVVSAQDSAENRARIARRVVNNLAAELKSQTDKDKRTALRVAAEMMLDRRLAEGEPKLPSLLPLGDPLQSGKPYYLRLTELTVYAEAGQSLKETRQLQAEICQVTEGAAALKKITAVEGIDTLFRPLAAQPPVFAPFPPRLSLRPLIPAAR